ncbi:MAG TPA: SCO family protein [Xanthomonadaceae bacterium]|nr:SCO family protein [Xanthomonadaceae bacterium]
MSAERPRWLLPLAVLIVGGALLAGLLLGQRGGTAATTWAAAPPEVRAVLWPEPRPLGDFRLHTQHGESFGPQDFEGRWSLVFFGYLQCPDVCPTTLSAMRDMRRMLIERNPSASAYRYVFVSVDPEFDRAESMATYLAFWDPDFVGLLGSGEALQPLLRSLAVMAIEHRDKDGVRSIDHTSSVMLIDPRGRAVAALPPPHHPELMLARFEQVQRHLRM